MHNYCELNNTALDEQGVPKFMDFERENEQAGSRIYSTSTVGGTRNRSLLTDYFIEYNIMDTAWFKTYMLDVKDSTRSCCVLF